MAAARIAGLRELALRSAPGDGATTGDIARLAGVSYAKAWSAINLAAVPSQRVSTPFGSPKACWVWFSDDAVPVLARRGILGSTPQAAPFPVPAGSWCTARELAEAMLGAPASRNEVASAKHWLHKEGVATKNVRLVSTRMLNIHPVGEALLAIADSFGTAQAPQPLETLLTTEELAQRVEGDALSIRSAEALQLDDAELPVPPYTLGAWLGDGTSREGGFTSPDEEVLDGIRSDGFVVHTSPTRSIAHYIRGLVPGLRAIDVLNNKHIPALYLRASRAQRLAVLQGLMDADGSINKGGSCELTLCREALATDALELIRSLGIKASITSSPSSITEADPQNPGSTRRRVVGTRWRMHFTTSVPIFRLSRKAERMRVRDDECVSWLGIEAVRRLPAAPARCLTVEHPSGMFLADGFVPTHNSWSASAIMAFWQANAKGWGEKLPGGAKDTMASTELAVSRANIWVIDDLAPTGDQRQAQAELARLGDLIRSVHNGSGKRRADQNMDLRATHDPRALLIITAENEHNVASVRDRIVFAPVDGLGTDEAVAAVEAMRDVTGVPGRVSGAVLQDLARLTATHGWSQYVEMLAGVYDRDSKTAADATGDGDKAIRHGRLAADIVLGIRVLGDYAAEIGCKDLRKAFGEMARDVFSLVADHYVSQKTTTPPGAFRVGRGTRHPGLRTGAHRFPHHPGSSPGHRGGGQCHQQPAGLDRHPRRRVPPGRAVHRLDRLPQRGGCGVPQRHPRVQRGPAQPPGPHPLRVHPSGGLEIGVGREPVLGTLGPQAEQRRAPEDHGSGHRRSRRGRGLHLVGGGCSHPAGVYRQRRRSRGARRGERPGGGVTAWWRAPDRRRRSPTPEHRCWRKQEEAGRREQQDRR